MALRGASTTREQQNWLDFKELAKEGAACVFTVREIEPPKDFGNGEIEPVIADVIVLTGQKAGEYHPGERILAKGIRLKLAAEDTKIGDSIVGRIRPYGTRNAAGLENEEPGDLALAEQALARVAKTFGGGKASSQDNGTKVPPQRTKVQVTEDDDEPPF
jgi:hypothetical protein